MIAGEQLVRALDNSEGIIMMTDSKGKIDFVNKSFERVYGYTRDEVVGKKPSVLKSGFHSKTFYDDLWQTISKGKTWSGDLVNRAKNGEIISEKASISPVFSDDNSTITGYVSVKHNITERKKLKEQLDIREQVFEKIFENSPVGIFILDALKSDGKVYDFRINRANLRASSIFNRISFYEQNLSSVLENKNIPGILDEHLSQRHGDEVWEWDDVSRRKVLEFKLFNLGFNQKCLMVSDVSTKVKMENRLKESEAHLRELNETKDKIFSIIAHDLKSPFQSIIGFATMLNEGLEGYSSLEIKKMATQISDVSEQTYKLLEDLLTWSKSQLGQLTPKPVKTNVRDLVSKAFDQLKAQAEKKDLDLINESDDELSFKADLDMLEFVVRNLVHNGIKFTTPGGKIRCYTTAGDDTVSLHVEDTGIGIQPAKQSEIFSLSGNLSTSGTSKEAGTGLGLMLSREMVEANQGTINVESELGEGSCFTVTLPKSSN
ncbi:MAG: PAS domain-containing sensor histidine kinase [Marinilabiliaceae bacterium]